MVLEAEGSKFLQNLDSGLRGKRLGKNYIKWIEFQKLFRFSHLQEWSLTLSLAIAIKIN